MNKTVKRILYLVIVLVIVGLLAYPKWNEWRASAAVPAATSASPAKMTIDGMVVKASPLQNTVNVTGTVLADESVVLTTELSGKVEQIYFEEGQSIRKGSLLLRLNDDEVRAELEKLQFTKKLNEDNEFRQKQLLEKEAISQEEYETALTTLNTIKAEIKVMESRLEKHTIRAPFDGKIGLRSVSEGSYVNPGETIAQLYKINPIKLEFAVPGRYLELVNVGDEVRFTVDAYTEEFQGKIYAIEPQIDAQTRTIRLRAKAENSNSKLLPGQFARINLILENIQNAMLIPTQAVIPELNGKKVYLYQNGVTTAKSIETNIRTETSVQVISGLAPGDTVVTTGILQVKEGTPVNIRIN